MKNESVRRETTVRQIAFAIAASLSALIAAPALAQPAPPVDPATTLGEGEQDVVWARPDGMDLMARIYRPAGDAAGALPAIVDVHGGAWSAGDRDDGALYDRALAAAGFVVISIDFRQGADHPHPAASADVTAAVRWTRLNADALGVDPDRIGLIGSSSGGHLAMLAALRPNADAHLGTPLAMLDAPDGAAVHDDVDASVDYVVALWPVSDPQARFRYATRAGIDGILGGHQNYFGGDEAAMLDASIPRIVTAGEAGMGEALPPILVIQPGMDSNIPQEMTFDLLRAYQSRDGAIEYAFYPGQPHGFGARDSEASQDMIQLVADFARRHGE